MSEPHTLMERITRLFKKSGKSNGDLPLENGHDSDNPGHGATGEHQVVRSTFLKPWAKRDQTMAVQEAFNSLSDLMTSVRDNLQKQADRQDKLLEHLSHLPQALQTTADSSRTQTETLKAIHQRMENDAEQSRQIAEILDRMHDSGSDQKETLDALRERVESINQQDKVISDTLSNVGVAMQTVSKTSQTSAEVLQKMRDNVDSRDGSLERILLKQNTRFTSMLVVAIFLSIAALVSVSVIGYLLLIKQH